MYSGSPRECYVHGMRRARRVAFAAPLVIVTAFAGPRSASSQPVDAGAPAADAGVTTTTTTTPAGPRPGHVLVHVRERRIHRDGYVSCHNFGPTYRGCNPPPPERIAATTIDLPIFEELRRGGAIVIRVPLGAADGVERSWKVAVLAPARTPAAAAKIVDQDERQTWIVTNLTAAELRAGVELELGARTAAPWTPPVPQPIEVALLAKAKDRRRTIVTVGAGSREGVERGWTVELLDNADQPIRGARGTVMKVTSTASVAAVDVPVRSLRRASRARVSPPPAAP